MFSAIYKKVERMDKLQVIADYSMDQLAHDQTGHGSDHTKRVVKLAEKFWRRNRRQTAL